MKVGGQRGRHLLAASLAAVVGLSVGLDKSVASARPIVRSALRIGDSVALKSYDEYVRVTLLSLQNPARGANDIGTPSPGLKYVSISLRIVNLSRERYNDSPSNGARIISTARAVYLITLPGKEPNLDEMAAIPPGGAHIGWITFQIPVKARLWKFRFNLDSGFVAQRAEWLLR